MTGPIIEMSPEEISALPWTRDLMTDDEFRHWVSTRKEAGRAIDIETCELGQWGALDADPYGVRPDLPEEMKQVGRNRFVRSPESRGWVCEDDLPLASLKALYARMDREWEARAWFRAGADAAREGGERDRAPMALRVEGKETDLARWLDGYDQTRAKMDEEERAPVDWFELGAKKARRGLTRRTVPLELREAGRVDDLAEFYRGYDETRFAMDEGGHGTLSGLLESTERQMTPDVRRDIAHRLNCRIEELLEITGELHRMTSQLTDIDAPVF